MENKFYLTNVVMYDESEAYVLKFILRGADYKVTEEAEKMLLDYVKGNGEVLKIDVLYDLSFENIMAFKEYGNEKEKMAFARWKEMYF